MFQPQAEMKWIRRSELLNVFKGLFSKYVISKHHKVSGLHCTGNVSMWLVTQLGRGTPKKCKAFSNFLVPTLKGEQKPVTFTYYVDNP